MSECWSNVVEITRRIGQRADSVVVRHKMKDCLLFLSPINQTGAIVGLTSHWHTVAVTDSTTSRLCRSPTWWAAEWGMQNVIAL